MAQRSRRISRRSSRCVSSTRWIISRDGCSSITSPISSASASASDSTRNAASAVRRSRQPARRAALTDLRAAFAGTPAFALPALEALRAQHHVVGVLTQPDRPSGRGRHLSASPVKRAALAAGLPLAQPPTLASDTARTQLALWAPDVLVVVAYGLLLPREVLALPRFGCLNIHASLLPRWRGAAPIQRALLAADTETGVSIMQMEAGLDTGPLLLQRRLAIEAGATAGSLPPRSWRCSPRSRRAPSRRPCRSRPQASATPRRS